MIWDLAGITDTTVYDSNRDMNDLVGYLFVQSSVVVWSQFAMKGLQMMLEVEGERLRLKRQHCTSQREYCFMSYSPSDRQQCRVIVCGASDGYKNAVVLLHSMTPLPAPSLLSSQFCWEQSISY